VQEKKNSWTGLLLVFLLKTRFQPVGVVGKLGLHMSFKL
jgi:hypothetical protein